MPQDATCRLWSPSASSSVSPSSASPLQSSSYALARTFRSGHDGRSIWSVAPVSLPPSTASDAEGGFEGVLTGGADGGVRCWALPSAHACVMGADVGRGQEAPAVGKGKGKKEDKGGRMKSFAVAAAGGGREVVAAMTLDGYPCHISAAFAGSSTAAILSLLPSRSNPDELRFFAFSNRGAFVCASVCLAPRDGADAEVQVSDVSECEIPLKVAEVGFLPPAMATAQGMDARATRVAIWDRAGWRLGVLDLPEPTSPAVVPFLIASLALDRSHPAPTSIAFLSPTLLLVGLASGGVELYSLPSSGASTSHNDPPPLVPLASLERVHADGVSDIAVVAAPLSVTPSSGGEQLWELQTVGRDGKRCSLDVALRSGEAGEQEGRIEKVDERALAKGVVEKILPPLERCQRNTRRYLAFVDTRAVVLDELARTLYSFANTGKRAPSQLVSHACGSYSYYRLLSGELHRQYTLPSVSAPPPALLPPLHGREIRAVKSLKTLDGRTLLATGTENGVLSISEVSSCNSLSTLFTNPLLPSSFKSLAWSSSASSTSALLFACGTRELLCAFRVTLVPFPSEGRGGLRVLPAGMVLADEGEEIRTMDMALIPLGKDGETGVLAVYSDGRLKLWSHRLSPSLAESEMDSFALLAATTEHAKLALRDLTPLLDSDGTSDTISPDLPAPFCTFCPHQSGINALAIHAEGTSLVFATAGDDNAVSVQRLHLFLLNEALAAELGPSATLEDAHASTIQGLDFLAPSFLVSSSVEQRLNAYSLCLRSGASLPAPPTIQIIDSTCLDVADCSAQELLEEKGGRRRVVVAGIGMQVVELTMEAA
ncbi:WD repeat-containing protein 6 [Rhodosporidiobolus nylandii]